MKLLIITQKVDKEDDLLGFFHSWLKELSTHFEKVIVICLFEGKHELPESVSVLSLGKEKGVSKLKYLSNFFRYIIKERHNYDFVFVHMNQIYVTLGGIFWKLWSKKIALWYVHRQKSFSLWLAEKFTDFVFTSAKESFRINSKKVHVVGHGIDTNRFICSKEGRVFNKPLKILTVGRITPIKNIDILINSISILSPEIEVSVKIIGNPVYEADFEYLKKLKLEVLEKDLESKVAFVGSVSNLEMPNHYCDSDILVNLSPTGGIDKVVLEAMSAGLIPLVSNEAFREVFGQYQNDLVFKERNGENLAHKIEELVKNNNILEMREFLSKKVRSSFETKMVIEKIVKILCAP